MESGCSGGFPPRIYLEEVATVLARALLVVVRFVVVTDDGPVPAR